MVKLSHNGEENVNLQILVKDKKNAFSKQQILNSGQRPRNTELSRKVPDKESL
jgi:hypothetical protein